MTAQSAIPLKWYVPFANGDSSRVELPVTTADPTRASQTLGFPPLTMQPPESGGVPPQGEDFNGGMNQVARIAWWVLNGGGWPYDSTFASNSNINGYPNGAKLQSADFRGDWINIADNNQNNPDTNGTNWVPGFQYGTTALTGLTGGTVTPTPAQAAKNSITLAGALGSALTIVLPTWTKNWTITNSTTGAFVTIVKTAAGSGVTIPQNASPTRVSGDGTNITQAAENVALGTQSNQAAQVGQTVGRLIGTQRLTANGTYTPTAGTRLVKIRGTGPGGGGAGSAATNSTQAAAGSGGNSGNYCELFVLTAGFATLTAAVPPGGAGGVGAANGTAGTASSLVANTGAGVLNIVLTGGAGGFAGGAGTPPNLQNSPNGNGASTIAGTALQAVIIDKIGSEGSPGLALALTFVQGGNGGESPVGQGGKGSGGGNGSTANGFGAGGGGAGAGASGSAFNGGAGAQAVFIFEEYA